MDCSLGWKKWSTQWLRIEEATGGVIKAWINWRSRSPLPPIYSKTHWFYRVATVVDIMKQLSTTFKISCRLLNLEKILENIFNWICKDFKERREQLKSFVPVNSSSGHIWDPTTTTTKICLLIFSLNIIILREGLKNEIWKGLDTLACLKINLYLLVLWGFGQ